MFTLLIDGNFFAQRLRNGADLPFINNPESDRAELIKIASQSLASEINQLSTVIDSVVVARDWGSWRKKHDSVYPLETIKTEDEQVYKQNRDVGEKDYDPALFYAAFDYWCDAIEKNLNIPIIKARHAEGDDIICILSKALGMKGKKVICWTSDGDYLQMVSENVYLLKFPKRQLHRHRMHETVVKEQFNPFNQKMPSKEKALVDIYDKTNVISINPFKSIFFKIIHGDPKDNAPAIFSWQTKGAKPKTMKPSKSHIVKAFKQLNADFDQVTNEQMYDTKFIESFIIEVLKATKQTRDVEHTVNVYESNRKLKLLNQKEIPKEIMIDIINQWNEKRYMTDTTPITKMKDSNFILQSIGNLQADKLFKSFNLDAKS